MKKNFKRLAALLLSATLAMGSLITANAAESKAVVCTTSYNTADYCARGYRENNNGQGPISITKATLKNGSSSQEVYLIGLSGTQIIAKQSTGVLTDIASGFNINNPYVNAVKNAIFTQAKIPAGSKLIFCGHSLGGMIAQQVAADNTIKSNYQVLYTVTFGSPRVTKNYEGALIRLGDKRDVVPYLSASTLLNPFTAYSSLCKEDGGYGLGFSNSIKAHTESYFTLSNGTFGGKNCWIKYDALGHKGGSATITFKESDVHYYHAPSMW